MFQLQGGLSVAPILLFLLLLQLLPLKEMLFKEGHSTQGAADMLYYRSLYRHVDRWTGSVPYTAPV